MPPRTKDGHRSGHLCSATCAGVRRTMICSSQRDMLKKMSPSHRMTLVSLAAALLMGVASSAVAYTAFSFRDADRELFMFLRTPPDALVLFPLNDSKGTDKSRLFIRWMTSTRKLLSADANFGISKSLHLAWDRQRYYSVIAFGAAVRGTPSHAPFVTFCRE